MMATVASKVDVQRKQGQETKPMVGASERVNQRKPSEDEDLEMEEADKAARGLEGSKHVEKELMEKEIEEMVKEIRLEEEKIEDGDKEMGQEEEDGSSDLFNAPHNSRSAVGLIKTILKHNKVVEEFRSLPNKKKCWELGKDTNLAKRLILAAGDVIEGRYWKGGDLDGKDGWKAVIEILLEAGDLERAKEASKAEGIRRTTGASKEGQLSGIQKQLEEVKKQLALLAAAMGAASPKQEAEAKRVIKSNKERVEEDKRKEAEGKKI